MTIENRVKQIFLAATEQPNEAARNNYLNEECGDDTGLRQRVEALLRSHEQTGSFLGTPAVGSIPIRDTIAVELQPIPGTTCDDVQRPTTKPDEEAEDLRYLSPSNRADSLGRLGKYEILQVLGKGGFGTVFRAFDDTLQRVVAVKVMAPQIATLSPARKRFVREARSSAAVRHENVVQIHDVGEQPLPYLVMEFIPGETLQQRIDRVGPLDVIETIRIVRQIAEGLAAAHACDLIHRDIKPGNILLEGGSHRVKITDFGLARAADDASISQSGIVAGTPMFMSPEQALGHHIDQRADLFSLGSVLYQMVSGRPPFRAPSTLAVLKRVAEETPRPVQDIIPETPDWLCSIITKLHAKDPAHRFQSAREVAELLADCEAKLRAKQEVKNILGMPATPVAPARSSGAKWAVVAAILLLPLIALTMTEIYGVTHLFRPAAPGPIAQNPIKPNEDPKPVAKEEPPAKKETPKPADEWKPLFNTKDLTGWKPPVRPNSWVVEDGVLVGRCEGADAYLFSERDDWRDFHMRVEAKINAVGDSGVFFRTQADDTGTDPVGGLEAHIGGVEHPRATGSLFQEAPLTAAPRNSLKPDEWFTLDILARGRQIEVKLDGKTVMRHTLEEDRFQRGRIALQVWGQETVIHFKKIEIKELKTAE